MKVYKIDELNKLHTDSKALDKESIAEMRSNILLIAGEHFSKKLNQAIDHRNRTNVGNNDSYKLLLS